ncbi:hypothetical protein ACHQM5_030168 [Ranunculus cassubicifolius]
MEFKSSKLHLLLRLSSVILCVSTALIVGLDQQTKPILATIERKATAKDLKALWDLMIIESVAACYNLLQLSLALNIRVGGQNHVKLAWICFFLDQVVVYVSFGATSAAAQASVIAVTGVTSFQWMKLCKIYTRFCVQIGIGLACGYGASLLMALVSSVSAFNLFRFYSSTEFLVLKSRRVSNGA